MTDKSQDKRNDKINHKAVLISIQEKFNAEINIHLGVFFDSLKGILFVFEQNSNADYKQSLNYTALQLLIQNEIDAKRDIISSINSAFEYFNQAEYDFFINENLKISNYQRTNLRSGEENEIAIIMQLINKSEEGNDKLLHLLSNLFSEMTIGKILTFNQIPVSPFVIMNSLVNSINELDLNSGIRMIVYNTFEVHVLLKLGPIYQKLIDKLAKVFEDTYSNKNNPILNNSIDVKFKIIHQLFERYHRLKKHKKDQSQCISKELIIQTLNIIQEKIQEKNEVEICYVPNSKELKILLDKGIVKLFKSAEGLNYKHNDSDTITLVTSLFQYISKDKSIPKVLKLLLIRLEIPVLKIALQDSGIFKYASNPIRLLLNQMSYVPEGFSDNFDSSNKYVIKLQEIVAVILVQSSYNKALYQNLLNELNEFTGKMKRKFNLIQRRIKEKAIGLEKISTVKAHVTQLLDKIMHDRYMPLYVRDLLLTTWKNVMVIEFLRHPEESKACQSKVDFVESLLDYSRPNKDKVIKLNDIKKISMMYSEGLDLVAFNSKDLHDKNNELLSFLSQVHGLDKIKNMEYERQYSNVILYMKNDEIISNDTGGSQSAEDQYMEKTKSLKVGNWLEFTNDKSNRYRVKISWISPITGKYLLVNSNGVRLADKTPDEIANSFRENTCNELKTIPLIDRALLHIAKEMNVKSKA